MTTTCPCCKRPFEPAVAISIEQSVMAIGPRSFQLSARETQIMGVLLTAMPGTARMAQIICVLWPNPDREPPGGVDTNIRVVISRLRQLLRGTMDIICVAEVGYRLQLAEGGVSEPIKRKRSVARSVTDIQEAYRDAG